MHLHPDGPTSQLAQMRRVTKGRRMHETAQSSGKVLKTFWHGKRYIAICLGSLILDQNRDFAKKDRWPKMQSRLLSCRSGMPRAEGASPSTSGAFATKTSGHTWARIKAQMGRLCRAAGPPICRGGLPNGCGNVPQWVC